MSRVSIVILNFNGRSYLEKFLPGVIKNSKDYEVIVADNCSTDDSVEYLQKHFPDVRLILLPENKGYSQGYNEALSQVDAKYYVLLNSDVEVTPEWISPVVQMMDEDNSIAAAQPGVLDFNKKDHFEYAGAAGGMIDVLGYPFCRGRMFLTLEDDHGQFNDVARIFWATGACLFIRSDVYHKLGGLDPDFFAHMEEIDLCWRINAAGFKVMYNGMSKVYHVGGGTLKRTNPRKTYLNFRNGLSLLFKNYSTSDMVWKFPARLLLDVIAALKFMIFDSVPDGIAVFRAHFHFLLELPQNFRKRHQARAVRKVRKIPTIYPGSIVFQYFLKRVRKFGELAWKC